MWLRRNAAKDGAVLQDISSIVMKTRRPLHGGLWNTIGMDFSVSDIDQILQIVWECFEEHPYGCAIRINKDAGFVDVGRDVRGLITDF